ncbi:MAG: hypothetical protein K8J08_18720 [Thermoanaerobaculia bacterium]|nr:hypothetical protein [Thermoanaerobaculia bacterium]
MRTMRATATATRSSCCGSCRSTCRSSCRTSGLGRLQEVWREPGNRVLVGVLLIAASVVAAPEPIAASEWRKLSMGELFSDVNSTYEISPDGRTVVFFQDHTVNGSLEIFSVPVDGSAPQVAISGLLSPLAAVTGLQIAPDSNTVVYTASQDTPGVWELYSVPIAGGLPVKLNGTLAADGNVWGNFQLSPAGDRVVYRADHEVDEVFDLFSVGIDGGPSIKLNGTLDDTVVLDLQISPAGDRVVYTAVQDPLSSQVYLYSAPITGGMAVQLNEAMVPGGSVQPHFAIDSNGGRVVYLADQETDDLFELFSVPLTGGAPVKLNGTLPAGGDVSPSFQITPAGDRVVYIADQLLDNAFDLFGVPIAGGSWVELSANTVAGGDVTGPLLINSVGRVVYRADHDSDGVFELYGVRSTGGGPPVKLNGELPDNADILDFQLSPDGVWVVYRAGQIAAVVPQLFRAPVVGPPGADQPLSTLPVQNADHWRIDPRGDRVIALSSAFGSVVRPWQMRLVAPLATEELVDESVFPRAGGVTSFSIGPDGSIVYRADQDSFQILELYSIPAPLFEDGFESGDVTGWTTSAP